MSAALQLHLLWAASAAQPRLVASAETIRKDGQTARAEAREADEPQTSWAFYRRHTEKLLRRYLYASVQVGRSPNLLADSVGRGWASSRRIKTFEDALIFVLDVERCLDKVDRVDRLLIQRVVLQEYTHAETAAMYRMSRRTVTTRVHQALDRLSERLVESGVLMLPH